MDPYEFCDSAIDPEGCSVSTVLSSNVFPVLGAIDSQSCDWCHGLRRMLVIRCSGVLGIRQSFLHWTQCF